MTEVVIVLFLMAVIMVLWLRLSHHAKKRAEAEEVLLRAQGEVVSLVDLVDKASKRADELRTELERVKPLAEKTELTIEAAISSQKERDRIFKMYTQGMIAAGNAQAMMLLEIENLARSYNKLAKEHGKPEARVSPEIKVVMDDFGREHLGPARTMSETPPEAPIAR